MRKLVLALATVAAVVAVVAISAQPKEEPKGEAKKIEVRITDEMIRHSRIRETLYFVGVAYSFAALALLLLSGASRKMRDLAARVTARPFPMAMLYIVLFTLAMTVLELPLVYYSGFVVPHQFDLTDQSLAAWIGDEAKALAVNLVIGALVGALALLVIRRVRRWWLALWIGSIPLILLMVVIQPIVLDPIFNKFEPLKNERLRDDLLELASRAGIEGGRVYQVDKSKQTKTMNAYVNGIGPTKRIVMWDTLLAKMSEDEVLGVMGHEMGHYVLKHMWKGLAFGLAVSFAVFFIAQKIYDRGLARRGARWGITGPGDPASVPWLLLILSAISFLLSPVLSGYSRRMEHQSDIFALELTRNNEALARAFVKLAEDSKRDPSPDPFIEFWRYTHPAIEKRIEFALSYKPWERGEPNRMWKR
ncbi:MAG TPA: M48 family metallopeptidase [Thermoanaerobaculia bacterium]|nr:M48 family metallopeptidase [Thermoanaerobaculia bacterium]